jgi:hypothetical protein
MFRLLQILFGKSVVRSEADEPAAVKRTLEQLKAVSSNYPDVIPILMSFRPP